MEQRIMLSDWKNEGKLKHWTMKGTEKIKESKMEKEWNREVWRKKKIMEQWKLEKNSEKEWMKQ